jgi:hypothetical protein
MPPANTAMGDVFLAVYPQHTNNQVGEVTVNWTVASTTGTGATWNDVVDLLDNQWKSSGLRAIASDTVTFRPTRVYVLDPVTGLATIIAVTANGNVLGSSTLGICPTQCSAVVAKRTSVAGRRGRGRLFHPFLLINMMSIDGQLLNSPANAITAAYNTAMIGVGVGGPPNTATVVPVLLHRDPLPLTFDPITDYLCSPLIGTQKRRGDYGRTNP